jgi:hypothetical protein
MPTEQVTMRGVYVHYFGDDATMIFASDNNVDPQDKFRSDPGPPRNLINEVLDKIMANCNAGTPIVLTIENGTFIVGSPQAPTTKKAAAKKKRDGQKHSSNSGKEEN